MSRSIVAVIAAAGVRGLLTVIVGSLSPSQTIVMLSPLSGVPLTVTPQVAGVLLHPSAP